MAGTVTSAGIATPDNTRYSNEKGSQHRVGLRTRPKHEEMGAAARACADDAQQATFYQWPLEIGCPPIMTKASQPVDAWLCFRLPNVIHGFNLVGEMSDIILVLLVDLSQLCVQVVPSAEMICAITSVT